LVFVPPAYSACLTAIEDFPELATYEQAAKHPGWVEAMNKEIQALQINNTWEEVSLPPTKRPSAASGFTKPNLKLMVA